MSSGPHVARCGICVVEPSGPEHAARGRGAGKSRSLAEPSAESHNAGVTSGEPSSWWRGVVRQAQATDTARGHAALLFEQALCRFARKSVQGAFAWWRHTMRLQDRHRAAARLFGQALCRLARSSEGASFVYWRGIVKQEIEAEARQRRSAAAMERVVRRFARMSVTGSFAWWRHVCSNLVAAEEQRLLASKLLARGLEMWARKSAVRPSSSGNGKTHK